MTWARIDDAFSTHRKFHRAGPDGIALFVAGLCYCARHATDGRIEKDELGEVYPWRNLRPEKAAERLVEVGFWEDHDAFWLVHDYSEYNETRAEIVEKKRRNADRQRRLRERRAAQLNGNLSDVTRDSRVSHADRNAISDAFQIPDHAADFNLVTIPDHAPADVTRESQPPVPSRPVPSLSPSEKEESDFSVTEAVRDLEAAYPAGFAGELRDACALNRKRGKMSDSAWLKVLERLAKHPVPVVVEMGQAFLERYADGDKGEEYLLGMVRKQRKPVQLGIAPARKSADFKSDVDLEEVFRD